MEKAVLLKKLIVKYFLLKSKRLKILIEKNLEICHFLLDISEASGIDIYNELKKTYKKTKKEDLLSIYKQSISLIKEITKQIDVKNLKQCKDKALRTHQLRMADFMGEMAGFFAKNNIEYFILSGTLIGALRHKGFIPWDDDIDIGMLRDDYETLKKILRENFVEVNIENIGFNKKNQISTINQTIKKHPNKLVFFIGPRYIQIYRGTSIRDCVYIDIFPHDYYKDSYSIEEYNKYCAQIHRFCMESENFSELVKDLEEIRLSNTNIVDKSNKIHYGIDCLSAYTINKHRDFMTYDMIYPLCKLKFENYEFYAPNNSDSYIKLEYPAYLSMPETIDIAPDFKELMKS